MLHDTPLITTIVVGLCLAFVFGIIANRLRVSPIVGYLVAGIIVGPYTGGFYADPELTNQLAEIGIILLMFGVGLHFSLKELLSVKNIAIPGAIAQMAFATLLGMGLGLIMGWSIGGSIIFGLALSVASTVVLLRALQERRLIDTERGHIAVGWLIVEDIAMVIALVLVPALAGVMGGKSQIPLDPLAQWLGLGLFGVILLTILKIALFVALMLVIGRRVIPWLLSLTAQSGSRELFSLCVLAVTLGVAFGAAQLFGVSLALGAFFAGMIMSESELSHRAAEETLPLRDAFAVLFFVSVGMLFDPWKFISIDMIYHPMRIITDLLPLVLTLFIIIIGKSIAAFFIVRLFRYPTGTALTISASLAQIGEFSFILASLGFSLHLLPDSARDLIVGGAILSIILNPVVFKVTDKLKLKWEKQAFKNNDVIDIQPSESDEVLMQSTQENHTVVIGYGGVGKKVVDSLQSHHTPLLVIEQTPRALDALRNKAIEVISGNGVEREILEAANLTKATHLVITTSNTFEAGRIVATAKDINHAIQIIAHAVSQAETEYLLQLGTNHVVMDDKEIANGMINCLIANRMTAAPEYTDKTGNDGAEQAGSEEKSETV